MNTKALRQKILDLAIHGKLVPQDPNDEPASVLLERIRAEKERLIKEGKIKRPKKSKTTSDKPHYENVPFELPSSWVWCKLHDIIQITNGRSQKYVENVNGKYPIYGSGGIIGKAVDYLCEAGSTIIGRKGTINNPLFVKERFWNIDTAFGMKPMYAISDLYFFYFCQYFDFSKLDKSTAVPSLTQSAIGEVFIPIPPTKEQKRITDEISYWLGFIDTLESNLINLQLAIKQTKSKILDLAIHGKLVPQYPTDEPASELLKRINPKAEITCDNGHYQKLPEGWCECTLGSLFLFIRNGINIHQDKSKIGYPITRIETISSEFIDRSRMGYAAITEDNYSDYYLQKDDILMSHINSPIHVGKCALCDIKAGEKIIHGMNLLCLRPYPDIEAKFILMVFRSPYFKDEIRPFIKNAVNQASINIRNLSSVHLHLPPVSEQHRIVAKIEEIFAQLDAIEASL